MGYSIQSSPEATRWRTSSSSQKTASGDFFANPNKKRPENRCNPLKTRQGNHPAPTKTALGVHFKNYLDHVYAVSDDNGNIEEHYRYSAFGEVEIYSPTGQKLASSAIDNEVLWNSRRFDQDTNLYYYKYRHYKVDYGRWLGRDPIEEDGGINLYVFVENEPVNKWDRYGLLVLWITGSSPGSFGYQKANVDKAVNDFLEKLAPVTAAKFAELVKNKKVKFDTNVVKDTSLANFINKVKREKETKFVMVHRGMDGVKKQFAALVKLRNDDKQDHDYHEAVFHGGFSGDPLGNWKPTGLADVGEFRVSQEKLAKIAKDNDFRFTSCFSDGRCLEMAQFYDPNGVVNGVKNKDGVVVRCTGIQFIPASFDTVKAPAPGPAIIDPNGGTGLVPSGREPKTP